MCVEWNKSVGSKTAKLLRTPLPPSHQDRRPSAMLGACVAGVWGNDVTGKTVGSAPHCFTHITEATASQEGRQDAIESHSSWP